MDIKDSYLHGTVGVVKSISVDADKLTYKLADKDNTSVDVTMPTATQSANGLLSSTDKKKLDSITGPTQSIPYIVGPDTDTTAGTWTGSYSGITAYTDGLTIIYVPKVAGASTTTLNINGLGAKTCYYDNANKLTTHYAAGTPILFTYIGGGWKRADYYSDSNTYTSAYCTTVSATADKVASCSNYALKANSYVHVLIRYGNTSQTALTLNINSTGAKPIYINGTASSSSNYTLPAGTYIVYYDGTNFYFRTDGMLPGKIEKARLSDLVTCTAGFGDVYRPIVVCTGDTGEVYHNAKITANYASGDLKATSFTGALKGTADKVANNLILKINSGTTEGTSLYTYNGSAAKTLDIKAGSNITLTAASNSLTIAASDTKVTQTNTTANAAYRVLLSENANDTTETTTARKSANLKFNPNTGNLSTETLLITRTTNAKHILFSRGSDTDYPYNYIAAPTGGKICILPNGVSNESSQGMHFDDTGLHPATTRAYSLGTSSYKWSSVYAGTFIGNLDGTYVNKLTGYTKATTKGAIAATDTLNVALGKLEFKADAAYDLVKGAYDGDGTIENLAEILKVLEGIKDTETIKAIIGKYLPLAGGHMTGDITWETGTGHHTRLPAHIYRNSYNNDGRVYDHYYRPGEEGYTNSVAELRVKSGDSYHTLRFGGDGVFTWMNHNILHTNNYTNYTVKKDGTGAGGTWGINISGDAVGATKLTRADYLTSDDAINNFLEANQFKFAQFKTTEQNQVEMVSNDGMLLSIPWTSTDCGFQLAFDDTAYAVMKGRGKANTWGDWYTFLHTGNSSVSGGGSSAGSAITVNIGGTSKTLTIPSSLPANGGVSDTTKSLDYKMLPSTITYGANTAWCKFATITFNTRAWEPSSGYLFFSGWENSDFYGILSYQFRSGATPTALSVSKLEWLVRNNTTIEVIAVKTGDNVYDFYVNNLGTYKSPVVYHMSHVSTKFTWAVGSWTTTKPTAAVTAEDTGHVYHSNISTQLKNSLTFAEGAFSAKTFNGSSAATVNIPTKTSHLTNNSGFLTQHQSLANYVTLDGTQTITGSKTFKRDTTAFTIQSSTSSSAIKFINSGITSWFGFDSRRQLFYTNDDWTEAYYVLSSANYTNYTVTKTGGGASGTWGINITGNAETSDETLRFKNIMVANSADRDLNTGLFGGGLMRNYSGYASSYFTNHPTGMTYGCVLELSAYGKSTATNDLAGQLAWDINHHSTDSTRYLWWRANDDTNFSAAKWHRIAYIEDIPTITDYYWADVKISDSSSTTTAPTFGSVTTSTIKTDNATLYLRYNNDDAKSICLNNTAFIPTNAATDKINLGTSSNRWKSLYTSKLIIDNTGKLMPIDGNSRSAGVYGVYDSTKVGHVWSMGSSYKISDDGLSTGNMYGLVYFHTNWSNNSAYNTATREDNPITEVDNYAYGHQIAMVSNGRIEASLGTYVWSRNGFRKFNSSDAYVLLGGGGHKTISSLSVASAVTADYLKPTKIVSGVKFNLSNASWTDTGYTFASLTTGTYAVQVTSGSNLVASGIMSVYTNLSDTAGDEIPLHVYGTAGWRPYLRTYANKLQISSNDISVTSRTVTIKIAQIL